MLRLYRLWLGLSTSPCTHFPWMFSSSQGVTITILSPNTVCMEDNKLHLFFCAWRSLCWGLCLPLCHPVLQAGSDSGSLLKMLCYLPPPWLGTPYKSLTFLTSVPDIEVPPLGSQSISHTVLGSLLAPLPQTLSSARVETICLASGLVPGSD